jgi:hypothetical protein
MGLPDRGRTSPGWSHMSNLDLHHDFGTRPRPDKLGGGGLDKSSLGLIPRLWNPTGGKTNLRRRTCLTDLDLCAG